MEIKSTNTKYFGVGSIWMPQALLELIRELHTTNPDIASRIKDSITPPNINSPEDIQEARRRSVGLTFDSNMPEALTINPGARFSIFSNPKREGKQDAQYRVSIPLPEAEFNRLVEAKQPISTA